MTWLFKNTPREALGAETIALHDVYVSQILVLKNQGLKSKKQKVVPLGFIADEAQRHSPTNIAHCVSTLSEYGSFSPKACLTMALACAGDDCDLRVAQAFLFLGGIFTESHAWLRDGGLHLVVPMIDACPEFLPVVTPWLARLTTTHVTFFDGVCLTSIRNGMESLKPNAQWEDDSIEGFSFLHLALCRGGYLDIPAERRDTEVRVAIGLLKRVQGFDSHPLNCHSANLRDRMRLLIFNAGFMLMLRNTPMCDIEASLRPVYDALIAPFGLDDSDANFLWRRAQLCLYWPFQSYYSQLRPETNELFAGDQVRAQTLFARIGVHVDQMDKVIVLKKGMGILYDPKFLNVSSRVMPGWSNPIDAFAHCMSDFSLPATAMLERVCFQSENPGIEALCAGRINPYQLAAYLTALDGHDKWLEDQLIKSPRNMPEAFRIESIFPILNLEKFCKPAQQILAMLYSDFTFRSFFKSKSPYHENKLEAVMKKFREHTDPVRQAIPDFSITLIRGMKDAEVISDEIMRDLEFSGFELSRAGIGSSGLNTDDLFATDLGL